ncbi:hypothetical protein FSP39_023183 [Pinctada imbricata]|uniref:Homeobox domain-containing protein n=1 Tax=Pinctada imbricata TaxID=66713 RepID=A0AA89C453_PINIB|nr:hypothetical protein FSP39_023183 [Pinctada imbricata]
MTLPLCPAKTAPASALGPLQAFCTVKRVQNFVAQPSARPLSSPALDQSGQKQLKFGINRILSDEFGKESHEKENRSQKNSLMTCGCGEPTCNFPRYTRISFPSPTLNAVHALQPPHYPPVSQNSVDSLPGPYSVLNDDNALNGHSKRKRSWSRAVFSNLQRKGLEKRFEVQKYVTKPDRRQLAAMLGLTDAQVKVWFQNRRMKWRHACAQQAKEKETTKDPEDDPMGCESDDDSHNVLGNDDKIIDEDDDDDDESINVSDDLTEHSEIDMVSSHTDSGQEHEADPVVYP